MHTKRRLYILSDTPIYPSTIIAAVRKCTLWSSEMAGKFVSEIQDKPVLLHEHQADALNRDIANQQSNIRLIDVTDAVCSTKWSDLF